MSDLVVALLTIFGTVASVTGVVLYVFNGTKILIREMREMIKEMHGTQKEIQSEIHQMVELLKKGFGDLGRDIGEIKTSMPKA